MDTREFPQSAGVEKPQAQIEAEKTAEDLATRFSGAGMEVINELLEEIESMELANRFSKSTKVSLPEDQKSLEQDETSYKKAQLLANTRKIQGGIIDLAGSLKSLVMDIKASQIEDSE